MPLTDEQFQYPYTTELISPAWLTAHQVGNLAHYGSIPSVQGLQSGAALTSLANCRPIRTFQSRQRQFNQFGHKRSSGKMHAKIFFAGGNNEGHCPLCQFHHHNDDHCYAECGGVH